MGFFFRAIITLFGIPRSSRFDHQTFGERLLFRMTIPSSNSIETTVTSSPWFRKTFLSKNLIFSSPLVRILHFSSTSITVVRLTPAQPGRAISSNQKFWSMTGLNHSPQTRNEGRYTFRFTSARKASGKLAYRPSSVQFRIVEVSSSAGFSGLKIKTVMGYGLASEMAIRIFMLEKSIVPKILDIFISFGSNSSL